MAGERSVVTEMGIFAIGFGLIVAAVWCVMLVVAAESGGTAESRLFIAGAITLPVCALSFAAGVTLLIARKIWGIIACVVCGVLLSLVVIGLQVVALGGLPINLMTLVLVAVPVVLAIRAPKAIEEVRRGAAQRTAGQRPPPLPRDNGG